MPVDELRRHAEQRAWSGLLRECAADDIVGDGTHQYASQGACVDVTTGIIYCNLPGSDVSAFPLTETTCISYNTGNTG